MTMRQRRAGARGRRGGPRGRIPFPMFLLAVCGTVTVGATSVRALAAGGHAPQVLSGTAERLMAFLDYFAGVFTLLSLTAAVLCGLAATDRLVLSPRLRVAAQSVHRATAVAAVGFLAIHIAVKVAENHASPLVALLPFGGGATFAVGLGTLAADLLVLAAATGAVRGRFADSRRPWLWRVLHASAYACWPIALAHGLTAGRAAAVWVLWSYGVSAALVALALLVRALGLLDRQAHAARAARLRAYAARRPSRAVLAELAALSREHEPVPYATHAAAEAPAPDLPREHPRLADTPPHGIPVQGTFGDVAPIRSRPTTARHAAGASPAGREHWHPGDTAGVRAHDGHAVPTFQAAGGGQPVGAALGQGGTAATMQGLAASAAWAATNGFQYAPQGAPAYMATSAMAASAPGYGGYGGYGSYAADPWAGTVRPGGDGAAGFDWTQQYGAPAGPGADWTSMDASGEWGPLTWDMPAAGGGV